MSKSSLNSDKILKLRTQRTFSEEFKRQKVQLLVDKTINISELSELYSVSKQSIYRWLRLYSPHHKNKSRQVVQMKSEEAKTLLLKKRLAELERVVGQKQLQIDYLEKLLQLASVEFKVDIKKNFRTQPSNGIVNKNQQKKS